MPINKRWNISEIMKAAREFERTLKRGERFTFEYVLLGGVNDSDKQAEALAALLKKFELKRVKVNLIAHNPAEQLDYHPPSARRLRLSKVSLNCGCFGICANAPRT